MSAPASGASREKSCKKIKLKFEKGKQKGAKNDKRLKNLENFE
jgi:hypothetical protein